MAAIGTNAVTSLARHHIMPEVTDNIYTSSPVFFRMVKSNKKMIQGGTQIEVPLLYSRLAAGGFYSGFDVLDVSASDTVKNAVYDWKQAYVPVTIDGLTLVKTDSPDAIVNFIQFAFQQAEMEMSAILSAGLWSDGTNANSITGLGALVDDGGNVATYGGITRSANTWWNAVDDSSTATLTWAAINKAILDASKGGKHTTLIASRKEQYQRAYVLAQTAQDFPAQPGGTDDQLASAGFTNLLVNNIPWVVDPNVFDGPNSSNSAIVGLNEDFIHLVTSPRADFTLEPFQTPVTQDAIVSKILWAGNVVGSNCATQWKLSAITA